MRPVRVALFRSWFLLLPALTGQAFLLFHRLDLLDAWGDELFTRNVVAHSLTGMIPILQQDIHPPLYYYLLHLWVQIPLPWTGIAALRAFSGGMAMLCTVLLDRFWLSQWRPAHRAPALALFAYSPCLLLYGRMARSYTMQTALAMVTIFLLWRWMNNPGEPLARAAPAFVFMVLLLYTHYLPGIAILIAFALVGWKQVGVVRIAAWTTASLVAYAPWIPTLGGALRAWGQAGGFPSHYTLTGSPLPEAAFKIAFGLISLTIGESFAPVALLLVPLVLWTAWRGCRVRALGPSLVPLLAVAALGGYVGAARWVTWPFVAARLLWLLPFMMLALTVGLTRLHRMPRYALAAVLLLSFASSWVYYFRRENFVNLNYAAPLRQIAMRVRSGASPRDTVFVDAYNADVEAIRYYLGGGLTFIPLDGASSARARAAANAPGVRAIWIVRNTRDVSPGNLITAIAAEACRGRTDFETLYERVPAWERFAMHIITGITAPDYFYQLTRCE